MKTLAATLLISAPFLLSGCGKSSNHNETASSEPELARRLFQAVSTRDAVAAAQELGRLGNTPAIGDLTRDAENRENCASHSDQTTWGVSTCFPSANGHANGKVVVGDLAALTAIAGRMHDARGMAALEMTIGGFRASDSGMVVREASRDVARLNTLIGRVATGTTTFAAQPIR